MGALITLHTSTYTGPVGGRDATTFRENVIGDGI